MKFPDVGGAEPGQVAQPDNNLTKEEEIMEKYAQKKDNINHPMS